MGKLPDDEQEAHTRPTEWDEVAQHTEVPSFSPGGKWNAWVVEDYAITWGDLSGLALRENGERPSWKHGG